MQALRLARPALARRTANVAAVRRISATATQASAAAIHPTTNASAVPLSNVEAQWERLSPEEQLTVHQQLETIQKRDWKTLSIDEKKAGPYFFDERAPEKTIPTRNLAFFRLANRMFLRAQLTTLPSALMALALPSLRLVKSRKSSSERPLVSLLVFSLSTELAPRVSHFLLLTAIVESQFLWL